MSVKYHKPPLSARDKEVLLTDKPAGANTNNIFSFSRPFRDPMARRVSLVVSGALERILRLHRLGRVYAEIGDRKDLRGFVDESLARLKIAYKVSAGDLASIPRTGPLLVVANHPFGGIEGLILASCLLGVREDTKVMANFLLGRIPELRELLFCVDPFQKKESAARNLKPLKDAMVWLREGHVLAAFPGGAVSHLDLRSREIVDPTWHYSLGRMARNSHARVIPVFFEGANSIMFQLAGMIHPRLRTALLPHELLNKADSTISVRIGSPIPSEKIEAFETDQKLITYLRMRTYALGHRRHTAKERRSAMASSKSSRTIVSPPDPAVIRREVERLPKDQVLIESDEYVVYQAKAHQIPNVLFEIGRLRELTFRQAGEGTGKPIDLDRFDLYYTHLFLWNRERHETVGAYRLGQVEPILQRFGAKGLYTETLFRYKAGFLDHIRSGLELGRSFVRPEYQKLYSPLLLLWKGIGRFVARNPECTVLFGPVTISDAYSPLSRDLIVSYLIMNHYAPDLAEFVRPRTPVRRDSLKRFGDAAGFVALDDLSAMISDIEADRKGVPVLLRQYVKLGGKLMGFNIDPSFGNGLDGLVLVDLFKCDRKVLARLMGAPGFDAFVTYHGERPSQDMAS
jgi:putative hemolysin